MHIEFNININIIRYTYKIVKICEHTSVQLLGGKNDNTLSGERGRRDIIVYLYTVIKYKKVLII